MREKIEDGSLGLPAPEPLLEGRGGGGGVSLKLLLAG